MRFIFACGGTAGHINPAGGVAGRIRDAVEAAFPDLEEFEISISKLNPPVGGPADVARVTVKGGSAV